MAFRFQKRIHLAKGLRLNLSKRGVGASVGPRGASVSMGRRGIHGNAGLPGTGLSYRTRLDSPSARTTAPKRVSDSAEFQRSRKKGEDVAVTVGIEVSEGGSVELVQSNGQPFPPDVQALFRKMAMPILREKLKEECDRLNAGLTGLATLHEDTPAPVLLDQPRFTLRTFDEPPPSREPDAAPTLWQRIWPAARDSWETARSQRNETYLTRLRAWEQDKVQFQRSEDDRRLRETTAVLESTEAMELVLSEYLDQIPWPKATDIGFDLGDNYRTIALDIDLPTEDEMPAAQWALAGRGLELKAKPLGDIRRRKLYQEYVHAVAFRVIGEVFARLPAVRCALVSSFTQRTDPATGHDIDTYLYSVIVTRDAWANVNFRALDNVAPTDALNAFRLKRDMTKTGIFKPVEPFTLADLEQSCQ